MPEVLQALLTALIGGAGALLTGVLAARQRRQTRAQEKELERLYEELVRRRLRQRIEHLTGNAPTVENYLIELSSPPVTGAGAPPSQEETRREVEGAVKAVQERLERIEQRFPEEATLDKIASINDAILATKIERLEKSIENLESRLLTKWDVATIVFAVLAAVGGIAGAIFAVANFALK